MTNPLANAGAALYGRHWITALAADLGLTRQHLSLIANGKRPVPNYMPRAVQKLLAERITAIESAIAQLETPR